MYQVVRFLLILLISCDIYSIAMGMECDQAESCDALLFRAEETYAQVKLDISILNFYFSSGDVKNSRIFLRDLIVQRRARIILSELEDKKKGTLLHTAVLGGHTQIVEVFVDALMHILPSEEQRLDFIKRENLDRFTALHCAVINGHVGMVASLLGAIPLGAWHDIIWTKDSKGFSLIDYAEKNGHEAFAQRLAEFC